MHKNASKHAFYDLQDGRKRIQIIFEVNDKLWGLLGVTFRDKY